MLPALEWLEQLWQRISGQVPPRDAATWLQGVEGQWSVVSQNSTRAITWRIMRLTLLSTAWGLRCRRGRTGQQFAARDAIAVFVERIRRLVEADFQRVSDAVFALHCIYNSVGVLPLGPSKQRGPRG